MTTTVSGLNFYRALAYAFKACPKDETKARLQHIAFIGNQIIGADSERWHVGILHEDVEIEPMTVARSSIANLLRGLDYCRHQSKANSGTFQVILDGNMVRIEYAARLPIEHEFAVLNLGKLPKQWVPPVPDDAPILSVASSDIRCGHMKEAMAWHRSWEEDFGTFKQRGRGGNEPVRLEVTASGELVAVAFLLPVNHAPAELPGEPDLFTGGEQKERSQSILDLDLSGNGRPTVDADDDLDVDELDEDEQGQAPTTGRAKKKKPSKRSKAKA